MDERRKGKVGGKPPREQRLKAALRENLRRRKAQARGRGAAQGPELPDAATPPVRRPGNDTAK
ncbi:MAG: hypothetical protein ACLPKB_32565 [Xanthobacteraceae bacterium]